MDDHPIVPLNAGEAREAHSDQVHFVAEPRQLHSKGLCDLSASAPDRRELIARHQYFHGSIFRATQECVTKGGPPIDPRAGSPER
jgi:hypothetical protein